MLGHLVDKKGEHTQGVFFVKLPCTLFTKFPRPYLGRGARARTGAPARAAPATYLNWLRGHICFFVGSHGTGMVWRHKKQLPNRCIVHYIITVGRIWLAIQPALAAGLFPGIIVHVDTRTFRNWLMR